MRRVASLEAAEAPRGPGAAGASGIAARLLPKGAGVSVHVCHPQRGSERESQQNDGFGRLPAPQAHDRRQAADERRLCIRTLRVAEQ